MVIRKIISIWCAGAVLMVDARSPYRIPDSLDPIVRVTSSTNPSRIFNFCESHLHSIIFELYDELFFTTHLLPSGPLSFRYTPEVSVEGTHLSLLIEEAVHAVLNNTKKRGLTFEHFDILKARDANRSFTAGLFILKFKNFPFVLKLFIETPEGLLKPGDKGFEPLCFYYMSGGIGRHLSGFTRIKNLETVMNLSTKDAYWSRRLSFPRKWFWLPAQPTWLILEGSNIGPQSSLKTKIPAVYAIVCDEIVWSYPFSIKKAEDRKEALALSNFLHHSIDSHINNFGIEKDTHKLVLIDFEHFPTFVGLEKNIHCTSYWHWYCKLSYKMLHDMLGRDKKTRRLLQHTASTVE